MPADEGKFVTTRFRFWLVLLEDVKFRFRARFDLHLDLLLRGMMLLVFFGLYIFTW